MYILNLFEALIAFENGLNISIAVIPVPWLENLAKYRK